jgi:hypothetical protein
MLGKVSQCLQCTQHVPTEIQVPLLPVKGSDWLEAIVISNYETMWLAHGSQVIDHMTRNKGKKETCLAGGILYVQACSKG